MKNFITLNFVVSFDENIINDEEIETSMHKSLKDVKIIKSSAIMYIEI